MKYVWKTKSRSPIKAQVAGEELRRMHDEHGGLTPSIVVDESRPKDAPLHSAFEWNDSKAAEMYRQAQAGYIIRSVVAVVSIGENHEPRETRAFVSVGDKERGDGHVYVAVQKALEDPARREEIVRKAYDELLAWQRKYQDLHELAEIFAAIDRGLAA
jgi:hypothetical protein